MSGEENTSRKVTRCGELAYVNAKPRRRQSDFDRKRSYEAQGPNPPCRC